MPMTSTTMRSDLGQNTLTAEAAAFYRRAMAVLEQNGIPFLVGGAYAFAHYTGIVRHTKDFDLFILPAAFDSALAALADAGHAVERNFPHWLGKAYDDGSYVDLIFGSGNGLTPVDEGWFRHAEPAEVLGVPVRLCPAEEMIWSKAFIMERERYDGADVHHVLLRCGATLDWPRMLRRFGEHWRVLLSHLVMFGFVYPAERASVPAWVMDQLMARLQAEQNEAPQIGRVCRGPLVSRAQYLIDVEEWGYEDARLGPAGVMSDTEVAQWTAAIAGRG